MKTTADNLRGAMRSAITSSRRLARKAVASPRSTAMRRATVRSARNLVPVSVRIAASKRVLRSDPAEVPISSLLLGAQAGHSAKAIASATGDLLWGSRRVADGPHAELLRAARSHALTDTDILSSGYGHLALACIAEFGAWFGATDAAGVAACARDFLDDRPTGRPSASGPGDPILVVPIRWSSTYQVLDGHHRIARSAVDGETTIDVVIKRAPTATPLMEHLLRMSWLDGTRELYQPLDLPELTPGFTLVRHCIDRRDKMVSFLAEGNITEGSYLDVASFYGWFVAEMTRAGFRAEGIERDSLAQTVGVSAYGLDPAVLHTGDAVDYLRSSGQQWDAVSCLSLLHHFVLGRSKHTAEELIGALDRATKRVLFLDTGQGTEAWFARSLPEWTPDYIASWLRLNTTFDEIIDLGPDHDAVGEYTDNYGRHLFALVRNLARP